MDVVSLDEGRYESILSNSCTDSEDSSSSDSERKDQLSDDLEKADDESLRVDLQKTALECYRSDSNFASNTSSDDSNDEEFQASALCQFMDILNDLDDVLDKSLLACLDEGAKSFDSDEEDVMCKTSELAIEAGNPPHQFGEGPMSLDDDTQVVCSYVAPSAPPMEESDVDTADSRPLCSLVRSKSLSDISGSERQALLSSERAGTADNYVRGSMRRLDPIVLPAISTQESFTLPVVLFLDHVNMRPISAPIQLQVTAANLSGDVAGGPLIVGRRALLMNRALSLPSPGDSDVTGEWTGRNTDRSVTRSTSTSSSSSESLNGVLPPSHTPSAPEERNEETEEPPFGVWPHHLSAMLACLSCTVGVFNISRFAIFSVHFGASFIVQFFILSLLIGIPLFTLYLCLGQVLESGPVDMWRISPIFQGVGVSLLITQAVIGMYSIIGVSWIFVYFRDSFINAGDRYKWALPHDLSFDDATARLNGTFKIQETVPQYFHGEVLQRNLGSNNTHYGTIKFQVAFNLAVVWMIVFVSLSKGLRSYGKAVYMLIFLPICGTLILCTKLLTLIPYDSVTNIFSETEWSEFFLNSNSWAAATQETFLTWGILGACVMQLTSHKSAKNKTTSMLQKESACIVAFTFAVLLLGSFLANTCVQILKNYGYSFIPSSFENAKSSQFLWPTSEPMPGSAASTPLRYMGHYGSLVGVTVWRSGSAAHQLSGWQPLQLPMQIVPATLAVLPADLECSGLWKRLPQLQGQGVQIPCQGQEVEISCQRQELSVANPVTRTTEGQGVQIPCQGQEVEISCQRQELSVANPVTRTTEGQGVQIPCQGQEVEISCQRQELSVANPVTRTTEGQRVRITCQGQELSAANPVARTTEMKEIKIISPGQELPIEVPLAPATELSPAWAVIFYFILIMFGIAQQLAIWHCVIAGVMAINAEALRVWETTITFLSCVFGLVIGLFLTTDAAVRIVHFIDYVWTGSWWQCLLHVALACGVFVVRGRPYSGEVVVAALFCGRSRLSHTLTALLSFTWNVILPVVLCAVCVIDFRTGQQRVFYNWRKPAGYWPTWCRQIAVLMQQGALLTVPITAFIQTWRYMSKGPPDILDRIQNLYRPRMGLDSETPVPCVPLPAPRPPSPPPKYTPPPSYSTATGARLLNTLRRSFRTLRRITTTRTEPVTETSQIPITLSESVDNHHLDTTNFSSNPPEYSGVFTAPTLTVTDETVSQVTINRPTSSSRNSLSFTRDYFRRSFVRKGDSAKSIRSSLRRSFKYGGALTTSHEHLVRDAEPISNTVAMSAMLDADISNMLDVQDSPHARSRASVI